MAAISLGDLRHTVVLERRKQSAGEYALATAYEPLGQVYAKVEGVGGAVYLDSVQIEERITHRVTMRFRQRTDFNFIRRGDQRFQLRRIRDPDGTRRWLIAEVEEIAPGADLP